MWSAPAARAQAGPDPTTIVTPAPPTPLPTAAPNPSASGAVPGIAASDFSMQTVPLAAWLDSVANGVFGILGGILTAGIRFAQYVFFLLAGLEFTILFVRWAASTRPLEEVVADAYFRAVQSGILYVVIGMTFTMPDGSPGWFPSILGGIIGIAQGAIGLTMFTVGSGSNLLTGNTGWMPGDFFTLFWNIGILFLKQAFLSPSIIELFTGGFTGATALWLVTAGMAILSAGSILLLGANISFRIFVTMFEAYLTASQCYLQGFLGSRITSGIGAGMFNLAFNLGVEMGAIVVVSGVFKTLLVAALNAMNLGALAAGTSIVSKINTLILTSPMSSVTSNGLRIVIMLLVDVLIVGWWYTMKRVPEIAARAISGQIKANPQEIVAEVMHNSLPSKAMRAAGNVALGAAVANPVLMAGMAAKLGGANAMAARFAPAMMNVSGAAARGGLLLGNVGGALGGALGALVGGGAKTSGSSGSSMESAPSTPGSGESDRRNFSNQEFAPGRSGGPRAAGTSAAGAGAGDGASGQGARSEATTGDGSTARGAGGAVVDGSEGPAPADVSGRVQTATIGGTDVRFDRRPGSTTVGGDASTPSAEPGATSTSVGGATIRDGNTTSKEQKGPSRATGGNTGGGQQETPSDDLSRLRFGGAGGSASVNPGASAGGGGSPAGGNVDPIFGGAGGMSSAAQMMLYRRLLSFGGAKPQVTPTEAPAVQISPASLLQ
jgi:hypothetical protein